MRLFEVMDRITALFPNALFDEGEGGEVVVHLGVKVHPDDDWEHASQPVVPIDQKV